MEGSLRLLQTSTDPASTMAALEPLEDVIDQIENAKEFRSLGGLHRLASLLTAEQPHAVKAFVGRLLGLAAQNNLLVQTTLLEENVLPTLLTLLQGEGTVQEDGRLLFAVSAICRNNPAAALQFQLHGGLEALANTARHGSRLFLKAVTLLTDLIIDEVASIANISDDIDRAKDLASISHYAPASPLVRAAISQGWCALLPSQLSGGPDAVEKTLEAIVVTMHACQQEYVQHLDELRALRVTWKTAEQEDFSHQLASLADQAIAFLALCKAGKCSA